MVLGIQIVHIHLAILCVTAVCIFLADHDGYLYFTGKKLTLNLTRIRRLHYAVMTGLCFMILTGAYMFADAWGELIDNQAFYVKMLMVLALVTNSFIIGNLMHLATQRPFAELMPYERHKLLASGALSGICWIGSAIVGFWYI